MHGIYISVFDSTQIYLKRSFSKMKYAKYQYRSLLTDDHFQTPLMIGAINLEVKYDKI